jgi:GT2 family glycosyltransferase
MRSDIDDLAVIVVSTNEAHWLRNCLSTVFEHAGDIALDVVVADNESTDGTAELVEAEFADARVVRCENRGFAHANNRGYMTCNARYALFLNPDTEILQGSFEALVRALDERPEVGLAGVRQVTADGELCPTIRRFPNALRALGEAFGSDRLASRPSWLGERVPSGDAYEQETRCDWTSGSFMFTRREALESAGLMDERFFIYSEEPDLSLRLRQAGWETRHLPSMTILHHAGKAGITPRIEAQDVFARRQYAQKHFSRSHRAVYVSAIGLRYSLRFLFGGRTAEQRRLWRAASAQALRTVVGIGGPPYREPPAQAVAIRDESADVVSAANQR